MFLFYKLSKKAKCESRAGALAALPVGPHWGGSVWTQPQETWHFWKGFFSQRVSSHLDQSTSRTNIYSATKKKTEQAGSTKMMLVHGQEWNTFRVSAQENTTRLFNVCLLDDFKPNGDRKWRSQSKAAECVNRQDLQRSTIYTDNWSSPQW